MPTPPTVLWALRSPCEMRCRYCYFGEIEVDLASGRELEPGQLSHLGREDLTWHEMQPFLHSLNSDQVGRVVLAGGEPLRWSHTLDVLRGIKARGINAGVSTNGLPLGSEAYCQELLITGVDTIAISLDSANPELNDALRVNPHGTWHDVVQGIRNVISMREALGVKLTIGVYSVLTKPNLSLVEATASFVADLGADFHVFQPVSLPPDHDLCGELSLIPEDADTVQSKLYALDPLRAKMVPMDPEYLSLVCRAISIPTRRAIPKCFGGRDLFFIEPDGTVWDCPSTYRINETQDERMATIRDSTIEQALKRLPEESTSCDLFSVDCVNMWQLMAHGSLSRLDNGAK